MKALIVDDDEISRMMLVRLLDKLGIYDVVEAEDGAQAWDMLQGGLHPTLIFCDARMPRMSGSELLARIMAQDAPPIPFIFVSASNDIETVEQALALGATDYLIKPFNGDALRDMLNTHFKHQRDHVSENPATSLQRLKIQFPQFLGYLLAFQTQLDTAIAEFPAVLESGQLAEVQKRLAMLEHACLTLGLNHAGHLLADANKASTAKPVDLMSCMSIVSKYLVHQIRVVKGLMVPIKS